MSDFLNFFKSLFKRKKKKREENTKEELSEPTERSQPKPKSFAIEKEKLVPKKYSDGKLLTYFQVGGLAKQCLCQDYDLGVWHLECSSESRNIKFNTFGYAKPDFKTIDWGVAITENIGEFTLCQNWQKDRYGGSFGFDVEAFEAALSFHLKADFSRDSDSAAAKVDLLTGIERAPFKTEMVIPVWKSPKFLGYVLVQPLEHFVVACRMEYNIEDHKLETHAFCVGYLDNETEYGLKLENFQNMRGSVFQRINNRWALALKANLFGEDEKKFTVGGQYNIDESTLLKARINDDGIAGLVYQFKFNEKVEGNYYFGFDVNSPLKGDHKIGICWRFKG